MEQLSIYRGDENAPGLFDDRLDIGIISSKEAGGSKALSKICPGGNWLAIAMGRAAWADSVGGRGFCGCPQGFVV